MKSMDLLRKKAKHFVKVAGLSGSVECASDWLSGCCGFDPSPGRQHSFVEIDQEIFSSHSLPSPDSRRAVEHEIFSSVILSHPLIPEGQLSVSSDTGLKLPSKSVVR